MKLKNYKSSKTYAFTLIELLTVIAVIAVLAGIIIPMLLGGVERAKASRSLANLRQIGAAMNLYIASNNGHLPYLNTTSERKTGLPRVFWPLVLETEVFEHPRNYAHQIEMHGVFRDPLVPENESHVISDYGANSMVILNAFGGPGVNGAYKFINILEPARTILVCTAGGTNADGQVGGATWMISAEYATGGNSGDRADPRLPGDQVGAVFADGHVEAIPGDKLAEDVEFREASFDPTYRN